MVSSRASLLVLIVAASVDLMYETVAIRVSLWLRSDESCVVFFLPLCRVSRSWFSCR